uniref:MalT-like TPR region domain-containing protein n=1 Tax=Fibrocapsa japonica TaxID=94617 RepID=A0A7S2V026_9STRA|mmetsp:Transcript_17689/g.25827  ORF Transcript_17689/g.25827 Transcript_17689/m.25827 type:complete len:407 (+) Transcript_17689:114-1334(+)|eukprot:CAMPEP_0113939358 /NCGR_PEP_ID=MMETSP1339-20121228/5693_1 /TAXON_ID=94617 /ORGANISM="Fibrocapsa japonica" /LENGTH=406 /DNA_ID=CAMNT_0000942847 /DNA_START=44 /DNA_END=1264 /DNA_ORIENTATION=+ /assembly_acc=CAM_ASM_000762
MEEEENNTAAPEANYRIEPLNTLAFPKGKIPKCELTGLPARVQCVTEHITLYYATDEHAEQAWHGIMAKISPLLGPLRAPAKIVGSEDDRAKRDYTMQMSKRALIDLCQQEASKFLVAGRYELAVPGAIQALSFSKEIFGDGSIEMVPPYLLLSEANLGLGRLQQAEEFLAMANWSVLKNPDCSNAIRSQLHRNFGKLYTAQDKLEDALKELAQDIYSSSLEVGPEHVDTSAGYFLVANIFYKQRKIQNSLAFYDKVVDIWYKFLASVRNDEELVRNFGEAQLTEGLDMLTRILNTRVNLLGESHIAVGEAKYTLGLLHLFLGNKEVAKENLVAASDVYTTHLGVQHPSTTDVMEVIQQLENSDPGDVYGVGSEEEIQGNGSLMDQFPDQMEPAARQSPMQFGDPR